MNCLCARPYTPIPVPKGGPEELGCEAVFPLIFPGRTPLPPAREKLPPFSTPCLLVSHLAPGSQSLCVLFPYAFGLPWKAARVSDTSPCVPAPLSATVSVWHRQVALGELAASQGSRLHLPHRTLLMGARAVPVRSTAS